MWWQSERLILREMVLADYNALYSVIADRENMKYYPTSLDSKAVRRWILMNQQRYADFGFGLWAIVLAKTEMVIGDCGLSMQLINGVIKPVVSYHIKRDQHGMGYATEAASACLDWTFAHTPFRRIYAFMYEDNLASIRTALKLKMTLADQFSDRTNRALYVYCVTREEWKTDEKDR